MKRNLLNITSVLFLTMMNGSVFSQEMPKFNSDQEKEAWVKENPAAYESMMNKSKSLETKEIQHVNPSTSTIDLPGFPQYVNTGNPEVDSKTYNEAKTKWISENQALYISYLSEPKEVTKSPSISNLPGFPVLNNTGNPDADYANYKIAKDKWYQENQGLVDEFYRQNASKSEKIKKD